MGNSTNILLTSAGRRSYLVKYFKQALSGKGLVHAANSSNVSPALLAADRCTVTPLIYDKGYIPFLLNYCRENGIRAIIPLFDVDLPVLSKNKGLFDDIGVTVVVSAPETVDVCNDKWKTYTTLTRHGLRVPRTFIDLDGALDSLMTNNLSYPLMVKPRWGMGSIAVYEAENQNELLIFYEKVRRNIQKTYLRYESAMDRENCVLIQEKLRGQEYGLDVINDLAGNYQTTICKMKCAMRSGETDCAVTVDSAPLQTTGRKLSDILGHIGNLDVDVFSTNDGVYVLEMNARFGGGYPFSHAAGVNLPLAIVEWLQEKKAAPDLLRAKVGVMSQKDIEIIKLREEGKD